MKLEVLVKVLGSSLALVPNNARKLGPTTVHQVELVVDAREHLGDGGAVGDHAAGPHHLPPANPAGSDSEKQSGLSIFRSSKANVRQRGAEERW